MNHEFLYLFGMVMLCRLPLLTDQPLSKPRVLIMSGLQLVFALLLNVTWSWLGLMLVLSTVNFALYFLETRHKQVLYGLRFSTLLVICLAFSVLFSPPFNPGFNQILVDYLTPLNNYMLILSVLNDAGWKTISAVIAGSLLVTVEVNYLIRFVFAAFNLIPRIAVSEPNQPRAAVVDSKEYNAGRFIGILERILIFFFVLADQFTAIAFILAAKGFTRFKDLDEREFAEYVLIGTLLSATAAVLAALAVKAIVG